MQWERKPDPERSFEPIFSQQVSITERDKAVLFLVVLFQTACSLRWETNASKQQIQIFVPYSMYENSVITGMRALSEKGLLNVDFTLRSQKKKEEAYAQQKYEGSNIS